MAKSIELVKVATQQVADKNGVNRPHLHYAWVDKSRYTAEKLKEIAKEEFNFLGERRR